MIVEHRSSVTQESLQSSSLRKISVSLRVKEKWKLYKALFVFSGYVHLFCLQVSLWNTQVNYYIITCNCYCLRLNPFFITCEIYFIYIFYENFQKNVKKPHRFHVFVAYINRCLRDQFNKRPCPVNIFFAFLKAAEHCYDALLSRCKVKPWVWKSNHTNALLCKWKSDLYGNSDFWRWVFKVFKSSRKPTAEKSCLENVRF